MWYFSSDQLHMEEKMIAEIVHKKSSFEEAQVERTYPAPKHILRSADGSPTDVFEFVCAPEWHEPFVVHSFDRKHSRRKSGDLVQFAAITSLVSGLWSWIHPKYLLVWCESFSLRTAVNEGETIKIFFRTDAAPTSPKNIEVEIQVQKNDGWRRVFKTNIKVIRYI